MWFHVTNVGLHTVACLLFTRVCTSIAGLRPPFATAAGLLFAAHPVHTEAVTGIVGRADVLACVFFLVSLLAYHGHADGRCQVWTSVILGGLSMLAKETGVTVFILNLMYDLYRCWPFIRRTITDVRWNDETCRFARRAAKVLVSLGILLTVRLAMLQGSLPKFSQQDNPTAFHPSLYVRLLTFSYLAAFNWWLLLCPATLSHDWQMGSVPLLTSVTDSRNLVTCLFFGTALLIAYRSLQDFEQQRHVPLVLGLLLLVLPFLPAANLVVTVGFVVAERVLYIPSLGCVLLVAYGAQLLWTSLVRHRQTLVFIGILLLVGGCFRVIARNRDWQSRESLLRQVNFQQDLCYSNDTINHDGSEMHFKAGLMALPQNAKMHYNFANFLRDTDRPELAISHYHKALQLWPAYASAHNNLGTLMNNDEHAEHHFLAAIRYSGDHVNAHYNLGQLYRMLERCIRLEPAFTPAYLELVKLRGRQDFSVGSLLRKVVHLNSNDPHHITSYAEWLQEQGSHITAARYFWKTLEISPSYQPAILGACRILRLQGRHSQLLQLITRWHSVLRLQRGTLPLSPHVYLHGWQLKTELNSKARAYDPCPTLLCGRRCVPAHPRPIRLSNMHQHPHHAALHPACNRTTKAPKCFSTVRQCRLTRSRWHHKHQRPSSSFMVQNILDTV
ncbi:uncharacterized protein CBL_04626 [Carabus blaptoides fortunei]